MLYNLLAPYGGDFILFNLFKFLTVRAGGALFTAFFIVLWVGPWVIKKFRAWQNGGVTVKEILPHQAKASTPTMGGVMILLTFVLTTLLWTDLTQPYIWVLLFVALGFGAVGFIDDVLCLLRLWKNGLPGKLRLTLQTLIAATAVFMAVQINNGADATSLYMPFFKNQVLDLGLWGFVAFGAFVIVGAANAVNLTDGLDGLVSIPVVIVAASFAGLAYIIGRVDFTEYLHIAYVPGAGEIAVASAGLVGAVLGFLWFNAPPARIFMGDTGALFIGAFLGLVSVIVKQEFVLAIVGGIFVLETLSVIVQVISFKTTGKRVFKMAPLHHHFEQLGWPESTIVVRFWIMSLLLALIGLATLKLR